MFSYPFFLPCLAPLLHSPASCPNGSATPLSPTVGLYLEEEHEERECQQGHKCLAGKQHACPPGFYQDEERQIRCKVCRTGRFQSASAQTSCITCPDGVIATSPTTLQPMGYFSLSGSENCTACPNGYYNHEVKSTCLEIFRCQSGSYVKNVSKLVEEHRCEKCPAGRTQRYSEIFSGEWGGLEVHPLECVDCPAGRYQSNTGQMQCNSCPEGRYGNTTGLARRECTDVCPEGSFCSQSSVNPKACPTGTACPKGSAVPMPLLPGVSYRFSYNISTESLVIEHVQCPRGKFRAVDAASIAAEGDVHSDGIPCTECPFGQYSLEEGAAYCLECKFDEYMHEKAKELRTLPDDLFRHTPAEWGLGVCIPCPSRMARCNGIDLEYKGELYTTRIQRCEYTCACSNTLVPVLIHLCLF
jgi:hypothetical protein